MGSRGSVIPLFKKQIIEQKRITVTNHNMSRFMMTLTQAANLTMQAAEDSIGGEVFVLKMPVIRLRDLAEVVTEEVCKKYNINTGEVEIKTIGLRPGEKMFEELMTEEESKYAYDLGNMYAVIPTTFEISKYKQFYDKYSAAKIKSYRSSDQNVINKESVRKLVLDEELI